MLRTKDQVASICTECPLAKTANIIGDTFTILIIRDLLAAPKRFSELEQSLNGVSSRTITKKLQFLLDKKLIRRVEPTVKNPHPAYSLTPHGKALHKIMETMRTYGAKYL